MTALSCFPVNYLAVGRDLVRLAGCHDLSWTKTDTQVYSGSMAKLDVVMR